MRTTTTGFRHLATEAAVAVANGLGVGEHREAATSSRIVIATAVLFGEGRERMAGRCDRESRERWVQSEYVVKRGGLDKCQFTSLIVLGCAYECELMAIVVNMVL